MLTSDSEISALTCFFLTLELMLFSIQCWICYIWPRDKGRLLYLVLLSLLIVYNLMSLNLADEETSEVWNIKRMSVYGANILMISYLPYYFYKAFDLESLRFTAMRGVPFFIVLPFLIAFILFHTQHGNDIFYAFEAALIFPFVYSLYVLFLVKGAMQVSPEHNINSIYTFGKVEMRAVYAAVFPWVFLVASAFIDAPKWIEVIAANAVFVVTNIFFLLRSGKFVRAEKERLLARDEMFEQHSEGFKRKCSEFGLSERETQVAALLCEGSTYRRIAESLNISEKTVDSHAQRIFTKTGVHKKIDLQNTLGFIRAGFQVVLLFVKNWM